MKAGRRLTDLEPAGFSRRAAAFVVDLAIVGIAVIFLLQVVLDPLRQALGPGWLRVGAVYIGYVLLTVSFPTWLYFAGYESGADQATPGKRWLAVRVTRVDGSPMSFPRALLRTVLKLLPFEVAHVCVALPANPFLDPVTGELTIPALDAMQAGTLAGLLAALLLFGLLLFTTMLHPDGRGVHDILAGTFVVGSATEGLPSSEPLGV